MAAAIPTTADDRIILLTLATGEARTLPPTYDAQPDLLGWTADSRVLFREARGTRSAIFAMPLDGPHTPKFSAGFGSSF